VLVVIVGVVCGADWGERDPPPMSTAKTITARAINPSPITINRRPRRVLTDRLSASPGCMVQASPGMSSKTGVSGVQPR
jgi:hypothetical protein